jgi:hypothetical protein
MKEEQQPSSQSAASKKDPFYPCVETGIWTPIPKPPPKGDLRITLKSIDSEQSKRVKSNNRLTFHAVGCSGRYEQFPDGPQPGTAVANALAKQVDEPVVYGGYSSADPASFLFHLGDIVYKEDQKSPEPDNSTQVTSDPSGKDQAAMYNTQFYRQYAPTNRRYFRSQEITTANFQKSIRTSLLFITIC